ncbi:signal peptide peptidase SppA [Methylomonas sp. AM2-LC]|uniref:signal peptide peptidase SppA n=1 Tax=Methylomonas sp. AM2-LC TaxID=3153301 RepID=UPI0032640686
MENNQDSAKTTVEQQIRWEKEVIEKLAFAAINEQKTARRWGIFFKLLAFSYLIIVLLVATYPQIKEEIGAKGSQHVAIVDVTGVIAQGEAASANNVIEGLRDAIKDKNTKGVILNINSPGGSPVQSAEIYDEIRRLKKKHPDTPIYAVVADICASGGYYIAAATDKIYVNQASIIGSIGVIMNGFGLTKIMDKVGVERRLLTAGAHKAMLDPFSPLKEQEFAHMQSLLDEVHQQFIVAVREGRGNRLKEAETSELFSGLVWTGAEGVKIGLADDFGSVDSVARDVLGTEEKVNFTPQEHLMDRLAGKLGTVFAHTIGSMFNQVDLQ